MTNNEATEVFLHWSERRVARGCPVPPSLIDAPVSVNSVEGTDYHAVAAGYVSVTPLRSDMTDHNALTALETWNYLKDSELLHKS